MAGFGRRGGGGGTTTTVTVPDTATVARIDALEAGAAGYVDAATVNTQLAGKADQSALDAVVATNATQAELDALQVLVDAKPDVALTTAARQPDESILLTFSDASTSTVTAPAGGSGPEIDPTYQAEKDSLATDVEVAAAVAAAVGDKADRTELHDAVSLSATSHAGATIGANQELHVPDAADPADITALSDRIDPLETQDPLNKAHIADADIHRGVSTDADLTVDPTLLADRATIKAANDDLDTRITPLETQDPLNKAHIASRLRPHLPDGGTTGQVPVIQADDSIAYQDAARFGQHIGDWDVAANADMPTPVTTTGDWWSVQGVTQAEQDAGGKLWNAITVNNGDLLASKDDTGTAFTHVRHPVQPALTTSEITSTSGAGYTKSGSVSTERIDEWGRSRRMRRVFNHPGPGNFDFVGLGYPDRTAIFIRNVSSSNGISIDYGTGGANTLNITRASGTTQTITALDSFNIQPSEIAVIEKDATQVYVSVFPGERVTVYPDYDAAVAGGFTPYDGLVLIRDTGELFGRKTSTNSRPFPADGKENADWYKIGGSSDTVVYPANNDSPQVGVINVYYQDDTIGTPPTTVLGKEYAVTILPVNRGVTTGTIEGETTHYFCVDRGAGPEWIGTKGSAVETSFYTATTGPNAKSGDRIRLPDGITLSLSATPEDGDVYVIAPFNSPPDWLSNTGVIDATGAITVGAGQNIQVDDGAALMTLVYDSANTNYTVYLGGDAYEPPQRSVPTLAALNALDIAQYALGAQISVTQEAANNSIYVAVRDDTGTVATRWERQRA